MDLYEKFRPTADRLLARFGTDAQLTRPADHQTGGYDPITDRDTSTPGLPSVIPTQGVFAGEQKWTDDEGRAVMRATAIVLAEPKPFDTLTIGSRTATVQRVRSIAPQGVDIIYLAEVL